jgi:sugar/nucleoside kinase (ribokinase family)
LGGSGNVAAGLATLGGKTAFIGKAGDDYFGKLYIQDLKKNGVVNKIFLDNGSPTGLNLVIVENKNQRSFIVFRGANDILSSEEIEKTTSLIKNANYFYFSGYSLVNNPQRSAILRAIDIAKKFKRKIVFDPGAHNLVKSDKSLFTKLLNECDVFSPNLQEARAITNAVNVNDIVRKLQKIVPLTILKCDKNGCILINKELILRVPSFTIKCLDPTGAGDAFTAAMIYGLSQKLPPKSICLLANWFAAQVVSDIGPRSFPMKNKLNLFLKNHVD